ncbi:MAG: RNA polymerase sigma factor [Evtepia gabavorous]
MDQIIQAKQGSQADMLSLLQQFQPILKKYGRKLWGEDGLEDMTAAFLQVIHDMKPEQIRCRAEGAVVQYLVQSVRHAYERLQRERMRQPAIAFSLNEMEEQDSLPALAKEDSAEKQRFSDLVKGCPRLTEKETYVLEQVYYWGYTAAELAPDGDQQAKRQSDQLRALGKLRRQWEQRNKQAASPGEAACFPMESVRGLE